MDLERERASPSRPRPCGLTTSPTTADYELNLIDTPGHVDFDYEVSRSLAACEGAVLVVDASQGVEAQTLANVYLALNNDLEIIPVINKIDLPAADPRTFSEQIEEVIGIDARRRCWRRPRRASAFARSSRRWSRRYRRRRRRGQAPRALLLDSWYDSYRGVVSWCG